MRSTRITLLFLCLYSFVAVAFGQEGWIDNYETAKARAAREGKDILIDFTGSDWCTWCKKLDKEVFDQPGFQTEAPKKYVLLQLDFPHHKGQSAALKQQNEELARKYRIEGYPAVIIADSNGRMIGQTGYEAGGDQKFFQRLARLKLADLVSQHMDVNDPDGAGAVIDDFIKENTLENADKQEVLYMKAYAYSNAGDEVKTLTALTVAHDADPNTEGGKRIAAIIETVRESVKKKQDASPSPDAVRK